MVLISTVIEVLALQLVAGSLLVTAVLCMARRRPTRVRVGRSMAAAMPGALLCLFACAPLRALVGGSDVLRAGPASWIVGVPLTTGVYLLWHAGRLERRGRLRPARRQSRQSAAYATLGAIPLLSLTLLDARDPTRRALLLASAACLTLATSALVLAALSRKPRPTATFTLLLHITSTTLLAAARGHSSFF